MQIVVLFSKFSASYLQECCTQVMIGASVSEPPLSVQLCVRPCMVFRKVVGMPISTTVVTRFKIVTRFSGNLSSTTRARENE